MARDNQRPEYSDVGYGISGLALTAAGKITVATTGGAYHGISYICSTTNAVKIFVFDSPSNTTGNILDTILIQQGGDRQGERTIPVIAKYGITLGVTGTGGTGTVFYGPKG